MRMLPKSTTILSQWNRWVTNDKIVEGKFVAKWFGPLVVKTMLKRGAYELVNYDRDPLLEIRNGPYLKKYFR